MLSKYGSRAISSISFAQGLLDVLDERFDNFVPFPVVQKRAQLLILQVEVGL